MDLRGRLGGEEFGIVLAGTGFDGANDFAESFRKHFAGSPTAPDEKPVAITISIGSTEIGAEDVSTDEILAGADAAMYRAKEQGRNRVGRQG